MCRPPAKPLFCFLWLPLAAITASASDEVDYLKHIKPLLSEKCYSCHGALEQESGLRLETRALMTAGGDSGPVIVDGKPEQSLLLDRVSATDDERMPPLDEGSALQDDQIDLLRKWIAAGAPAPEEVTPPSPNQHWAFQSISRPAIPERSTTEHPIDALLSEKRESMGLKTQSPASRSLRIRRLYLDLIGLPPSQQQLDDPRPWQEIVDELLASPQHGERWARHWMDIWRYCDWYGLGAQLRVSQKHMWHWRDWIVESLNRDKGYDRMIHEMLAGDELAPNDPEVVAATGFLARNYYLFNRTTWLDSTIEHTGKAFLGLTLNCAKCHDHKYDPISHVDYYRFRAIFEPHQVRLDPIAGVTDFEKDGLPRVFDDHVSLETYLHVRGDPKNPDKENPIGPGVPNILASFAPEIEAVELPVQSYAPGTRKYVQNDRLLAAQAEIRSAEQAFDTAKKKLADMPPEQPPVAEPTPPFEFVDEFDQPRPDHWEVIGDGWEYRNGKVCQTKPTREPYMLRLLHRLPRDFDLTCVYTTTGGTTYKSVTVRFDQSEDDQYNNYVYTSAHAPGPKLQVAFTRGGESQYPGIGRVGHKIEIGRKYKLRFAIRDTLVNVWLDDQFMIAYRFPDRKDGFLCLSAFDATAEFDSIAIRSLAPELELSESKDQPAASISSAEAAVKSAEAKLDSAIADYRAIEATIEADIAKFHGDHSHQAANELFAAAARLQAEAQVAKAQYELLTQNGNKANAARQQLAAAKKRLAEVDAGDNKYDSIRGAKKALESPAHKETDYPPSYSPLSTGRRLALARWMTAPENPLTARVAVNHIWMRHFGSPLVESVFDFGLRAKQPIHADVLDLLASELIASGWSMQHIHRLIVTSEAYQMSSSTLNVNGATLETDPSNLYYWRMNPRRMEAQVVRDSLLSFAGKLDRTIGGPSVDPAPEATRRSLYFTQSRDAKNKFLETFDNANVLQCYRRLESIVPQQALAMSNSSLAIRMSDHIAARISNSIDGQGDDEFIKSVFHLLLGRTATPAEIAECRSFFAQMDSIPRELPDEEHQTRVKARFVQAILNHNDFITVR